METTIKIKGKNNFGNERYLEAIIICGEFNNNIKLRFDDSYSSDIIIGEEELEKLLDVVKALRGYYE